MKKNFYLICLVALVGLFLSISTRSWSEERTIKRAGKRVALVLGNAGYGSGPLQNPVNDARDMGAALGRLGFDVILRTDADKRTMLQAVDDFYSRLRGGEAGLFFYAGHGVQVRERNYLVPVNAVIKRESEVEFEAVDLGRIVAAMEDAGSKVNIVILDACRDNPFKRSFRSASRGLARIDAPLGTVIAYATAPGQTAADGQGRNGVYTSRLLAHLATPGLSVQELLMRTRADVVRLSGQKQVPWESSSLTGHFYFTPGRIQESAPALAVTAPAPRPSPRAEEPASKGEPAPTASLEELRRDFVGEWSFYWRHQGSLVSYGKQGYIAIERIKALGDIGFGRADMGHGRCEVTSARFEGNKLVVGLKRATGKWSYELTFSRGAKGMAGSLSYSYFRQPPQYANLKFETE